MAETILKTPIVDNITRNLAQEAANPYYPIGSYIAGYAANEWSVPALLGVFFGACTLLFTSTYVLAKKIQPTLTGHEVLAILWFVLSGAIHLFFEGYYALNYVDLGSHQTLIGQMWKEYAFSDSRYLTRNSFVLCMESITAMFWGPGCLLAAALIVKRSPWRFPVQMIVSMGQFYGDVLYYATSFFDAAWGIEYSRPEAFYFWVYFVFMNAFWIVIPGLLIYQSASRTASAISTVSRLESTKKVR